MPDFTIPLQTKTPSLMGTLGDIIGVAQGAQQLQTQQLQQQRLQQEIQTGQFVQQQEQAGAQSAQQQMNERQLLQTMLASGKDPDGNSIKDANGEINAPAFAAAAGKYMPLLGQGVTQSIIQTQDNKIKLNESVRGLQQSYRNDLSGIVRSSIGTNDNPQQIGAKLDAYAQNNPDAAPSVGRAKALLTNMAGMPDQKTRDTALLHLSQEFQPSGTTEREQAPSIAAFTTPGGDIGTMQTNPLSPVPMGKVGPTVAQGIAPTIVTPPGGIPTAYKGGGTATSPTVTAGPPPTNVDWENFGRYQANLDARVQVATDSIPRIQMAEQALDSIRAGAGASVYADWARRLQAVGMPKSLVDAVANGDLAKTQEAEKYLFQTTFSGLRQSMQGDPARVAEFKSAEEIFPSIGTDPRATKAVLGFMVDQGNRDFAEQQALRTARTTGSFNPVTWQADYQQALRARAVPGVPSTQVPAAVSTAPKTATEDELKAYADKHKLTVDAARAHALANGIRITP